MKLKKIAQSHRVNLKLKNGRSPYDIDTDDHDPKLPGLFVFCGSRGSGKTYACVGMIAHFEKKGYINRTFLICPTLPSNNVYRNLITLDPSDTCDQESKFHSFLRKITKDIKEDWDMYKEEQQYIQIYKEYRRHPQGIRSVADDVLLERRGFAEPMDIPRPSHLLIVDDAQGTDMYTMARRDLMNHITIKHRHIPVTVCFLVQSWTGLPRVIRLNATHFIIYKTGDNKQLSQIYNHFGTLITFEEFLRMYKYAVSQPYGFLYIDTVPKQEYMRFRSGFNDFILDHDK